MILTIFVGFCLAVSVYPSEPMFSLDTNTTFYEGEMYNYVMSPPSGFRLTTYQAKFDGYSLAFVPEKDIYDSAGVIIGVHIFKIRGLNSQEVITSDTTAIRNYYGTQISIRAVESAVNALGDSLATFYFDDQTGFIPNVMIAYFDGGSELIVYELVIRPSQVRVRAEEKFLDAVRLFKALRRAELGQN